MSIGLYYGNKKVSSSSNDINVKSFEGELTIVDTQTDYEVIHSLNSKNIVVSVVT